MAVNLESGTGNQHVVYQITAPEAYAYLSCVRDATGDVVLLKPNRVKEILKEEAASTRGAGKEKHPPMNESRKALLKEFHDFEKAEAQQLAVRQRQGSA